MRAAERLRQINDEAISYLLTTEKLSSDGLPREPRSA